ncbi:hypothetical protein [Nocardia brasiliensis]|uniref:hypothetical protein n=1 Tax=Nocardia brasiliensis TaxID=37326 RepID=UPI00245647CB|nr:hypothetical protein [Nocardia brasiliensis]
MSTFASHATAIGPRYVVTDNPVAGRFNAFQVVDARTGQRPAAAPFAYAMHSAAREAADRLNDSGAFITAVMAALKVTEDAMAYGNADDADLQRTLEQVEDILRTVLPE